jgi:hypothetical protein
MGEEIHVTKFAGEGVNRPGRSDANTDYASTTTLNRIPQHRGNSLQRAGVGATAFRRTLEPTQKTSALVDDAYGDLCTADINGAN